MGASDTMAFLGLHEILNNNKYVMIFCKPDAVIFQFCNDKPPGSVSIYNMKNSTYFYLKIPAINLQIRQALRVTKNQAMRLSMNMYSSNPKYFKVKRTQDDEYR